MLDFIVCCMCVCHMLIRVLSYLLTAADMVYCMTQQVNRMKVNAIVNVWTLDIAFFLEINLVRETLKYGTLCQ